MSASPTNVVGQAETSRHPGTPEQVYLIIRSDDAGMSHSVNMGLERLIEKELRAQIERALRSGLKIDYVDYHMGTVVYNPQFREIAERLAKEFGLGMSQYFGETRHDSQYLAAPPNKADSLVAIVDRLHPRFNLLVTHLGIDNSELGALLDMNTDGGLPEMSKNRQGELDALTSQRFRDALKARNVQLMTYRQLIAMRGLKSMRRPEG